ncbi:hypothetical protein OSB04_000981 [Centaurea solstitialis]|uniref:Uncharacterized protein n=1 Tax=Centaurea solstitialis TaxID=347529 RepID=A0AA38U1W8_9ASTR|nr:hypothetical protein OSB04_000981 [Centaurea solstitialis]
MGRPAKNNKKAAAVGDQEIPNLREMIAAEVGEALHEMLPGYFAQMKEELMNEMRSQVEAAVAARPGGSGGSGGGQSRVTTYKDFSACQPPQFNGQKDPVASSRWISEVEGAFLTSSCSEEMKVRYASNLLRKAAKDWWNLINQTRTPEQIAAMTWEQFKELFKEQYVPQVEVERLTGEFLAMKQTTETVNEITDLFLERSLFCPEYVASERMKMSRYVEVLKPEIREVIVLHDECFGKWDVTRFIRRTGRNNFDLKRGDKAGFDKSKVRCYKCNEPGHFARECKGVTSNNQNNGSGSAQAPRFNNRGSNSNPSSSQALVSQEGQGFDWSDQAEEAAQNQALMAEIKETDIPTEVSSKLCSDSCLETVKKYRDHNQTMSDSIKKMERERERREYVKIIDNLEDQIKAYKANELQFEYDHNYWKWEKKELERKLSKEKEEVESARKELSKAKEDLDKFSKSSKALESIIRAQVTDDLKRGIGYNSTPPPYNQNYIPPTTDLLESIDRSKMKEGLDRIDPVDSEEESDKKITSETIPDENHLLTNEKGGMPFVPSKKIETTRKDKGKSVIGNNSVASDSSDNNSNSVKVNTAASNISSNNSNTATSQVNTAASNNSSGNSNNVTTDKSSMRKPIITKYSSHEIPNKDYLLKLNRLTESNQGRRSSLWHVDSGCSRHMTGIMSLLEDFKRFEGGHVAFGDNPNGGKISGKGKVSKGKMTFDDLYFVEQLKYNLLSVSQVCDKKFGVFFTDTECLILAPGYKIDESKVMLRTPRKDNVYCLDIEDASSLTSLNFLLSKASVSESSLWHRRMCHMNFKNMNLLVKNNLVSGLPAKEFSCDDHCVACLKGKQHKNSHKSKEVNTISSPLQLLHMDLFGPTNVMSIGKKSYCLVIVDDYSRFTWVYFLRTKDETSGLIKPFVTRVENKTNLRVKIIRSDNGTEFKNANLNSFCEEKGIERQYSAPRTPQQNGVAERRNRTLIEAARTMLADSKLPITFWAEAVNTA